MHTHHGSDHRRGQAMAEFALVLPLFILLLVGIIDGGRMVFTSNHLAEAAREGARWGSVQGRSATDATRNTIEAETVSRINGVGGVTVTATCERGGSSVTPCRSGDILVVAVDADFEFVTPFIGQLIGIDELTAESKVMVNQ